MANNGSREATFQALIDEGSLEIGDGYRAKNNELGGTGPIFLRAGHVSDTHIDFAGVERFHEKLRDRLGQKFAMPGDTIVTTKGNSTGRTSFVTERMPEFVYSPHLSYWRSRNPKIICGGFLRYWSRGSEFITQLGGMSASTDMAPYLSLTDQRRLRITLPPIERQEGIADILGTLDDKIELNRRMNETLEAMARRLFRSWFVDFDPVHAKAALRRQHPRLSNPDLSRRALPKMAPEVAELFPDSFGESTLGPIPKGWNAGVIGDLATLDKTTVNPSAFPVEAFDHYSIPAFDVGKNPVTDTGGQIKSNKFVVTNDCVLLTKLNPRIRRVWLPFPSTSRRSLCSTEFLVLKPEDGVPREFLFSLVASEAFFEVYETMVTGTSGSHQRIRPEHLLKMNVVIPPACLLNPFAETLSTHFTHSEELRRESKNLAITRDRLLPRLLSGECKIN